MQKLSLDFIYMRHGQSADNFRHIVPFNDACEGLTELGRKQAQDAADNPIIKNFKPDIIIASPLLRARQTAEIMANILSIGIEYSDLIQEQNMGLWEGKNWSEIMPFLEAGEAPPKGESFSAFDKRIDKAIMYLSSISPHRTLVISHGGFWFSLHKRYSKK